MAGLAFALTPITVAIARHNNPDELLILCCVAALWCAVRALETGRTKWLVLTGVCVGLGFETKMGVALFVVPGIALAWMWSRWGDTRARVRAFRQLLAGGAAMVVVGGAWPLLVTLTPAADRPWISGTSDNSIWSLIFGYNGLGRVAGQSGGPAAAAAGAEVEASAATVRRRHRAVPAAPVGARRPGRVAARVRGGGRAGAARAHPAAPARSAHRLADRGRRRVPDARRSCSASRRASSTPTTSRSWRRWAAALVGAGVGLMLPVARRRARRARLG